MKEQTLPNLEKTRKAIAAYDKADRLFNTKVVACMSPRLAVITLQERERLGEAVGIAYGEDTQDRNSPETCRQCVRPGARIPSPGREESFVRRMVRQWEDCYEADTED